MDKAKGKDRLKEKMYKDDKGYTGNPLHSNEEDGSRGKFRSGYSPEGVKPSNF